MLSKKHLLFLLAFVLIGSITVMAQDEGEGEAAPEAEEEVSGDYPYPSATSEEYSDFVPKRRQDQQAKFLDGNYNFPAKPRDKWEVGIDIGTLLVSGDVKTGLAKWSVNGNFHPHAGIGLHVRRSFGYVFSARLSAMMGTTWGQNWQPATGWSESSIDGRIPNQSLAGNERYDQYNEDFATPVYAKNTGVFYNYKTKIRELALSGVVNLHNIRFHKRETKVGMYGLFGIGGVAYRTFQDQLDGDGNIYADEYDRIRGNNDAGLYENRGDLLSDLMDTRDGTFESQAERHFDDWTPFDAFSFKPTAHVGLGMSFKLSRVINLGVESKVTYTNDDLLDGQRWQEWGALTRDYDTFVFTGVNLNFNIGGKNSVEPLWWMNPLDYSYEEIANECCDELELPDFNDDDNDGVPNAWDEEPDSREGCPVDTKGVMLDSDRDGILDCDDSCPHSSPIHPLTGEKIDLKNAVDESGCHSVELSCKDIPDLCDCVKECQPPRVIVDAPRYNPCTEPLPNILFDLNKYSVKDAFAPQLQTVATWMRNNPSETLCVVGHTDVRGGNRYNEVLSWKRANEVVNKLVSEYGISRSRLRVQYSGETSNVVGGLADSPLRKAIDADHALNRRVEFRCCTSGDMPRPAGPDAGTRAPRP